jgi:hypothetical protein
VALASAARTKVMPEKPAEPPVSNSKPTAPSSTISA